MNAPHPARPDSRPTNWFRRHKILSVFIAVVAVAIAIAAITEGSGGPSTTASTREDSAAEPVDSTPGFGTPVRDGKFEFTVTGMQPAVPSVGQDFLTETAQGEYVLVTLTVSNVGDQAQGFATSSQKLLDGQGRQFSVDDMATIVLDQNMAYAQINPGNSIEATVVFDVPVGTVPAEIEVHDSLFSGGATVTLQ
jgi:hypothetical protein